jgi:hypothetical protein
LRHSCTLLHRGEVTQSGHEFDCDSISVHEIDLRDVEKQENIMSGHDPNRAVPAPVKEPTVEERQAIAELRLDEIYVEDAVAERMRRLQHKLEEQ